MTVTYCAVLGCSSSSKGGEARFFKFPKVSKKFGDLGKLWKEFTRRKNFKSFSWRFCHLHFPPECYKPGPKGRLRLKKGSVPTIYYKNGQKIVVPYNADYQKYYGPEAERLFEETEKASMDHGKELLNLRYKKLCDLKNLCRFCFTNSKDTKCIDMSALTSYSVDPEDMLKALSCSSPYTSALSEIICETCFLKVIEIHNFRKKCSEQQKAALAEMDELDRKIQKVQSVRRSEQAGVVPWFKVKFGEEPEDFQNSMLFNSSMVTVDVQTVPPPEVKESDQVCEILVKQEPNENDDHDLEDDYLDDSALDHDPGPSNFDSEDDSQEFTLSHYITQMKVEKLDTSVEQVDETGLDLSTTIKSEAFTAPKAKSRQQPAEKKKRENFKDRSFECFFCRQKFVGRTNFKKHPCEVKFRECEVPECGKKFPNQGSYANHLIRIHGLPRITKQFCPGCKTYYQMNIFQFQDHTKNCEHNKEVAADPIKCELCSKVCSNLEAYTAHKLFHATKNLVESVDENGVKTFQKKKVVAEKEKICDLCGKVLSDYKNLRKHKVNVHLVDFTGDMFYCDLCPAKKPTRRLIYNHMKSVHIVNWHRCPTCGKDFKSRRLLARHVLYMHERHRLNIRCHICPHKPGFNATVYLEQHMRKHHGENSAKMIERYRCDYGFCEATYSNQKTLDQHKVKAHGYYYY